MEYHYCHHCNQHLYHLREKHDCPQCGQNFDIITDIKLLLDEAVIGDKVVVLAFAHNSTIEEGRYLMEVKSVDDDYITVGNYIYREWKFYKLTGHSLDNCAKIIQLIKMAECGDFIKSEVITNFTELRR